MSNGKPTLDEMLTSFGHASKCVLTASQQVLAAVSDDGRDAGIKALELALRQEQFHRDQIIKRFRSVALTELQNLGQEIDK